MRRNVERVMALEAAEHQKATTADRVADGITTFSGSVRFVWINLALIGGWMAANLLLPKRDRLDPFPFPLLTLVLSIEAMFHFAARRRFFAEAARVLRPGGVLVASDIVLTPDGSRLYVSYGQSGDVRVLR